jgi:hypothetical protein
LAPEDDLPDVATIPEEELGCRVTYGGNLRQLMVGMIYRYIYIELY